MADDLISKALGLFSGPDYLSNAKEASFANMPTQDETNADFFKADRAARLAREIEANKEIPMPPRRPPVVSEEAVAAAPALPRASLRVKDEEAAPVADQKFVARASSGPELTPQQRDLIIRTIAAEASGRSLEEAQAIANVILNRIQSGNYGASPEAVLLAKNQFEPWSNPAGPNYPMRFLPNSKRYGMGQQALEAALSGDDITRGALNFWGPKAQSALGRKPPRWAAEMPDFTDIGETRFHRPRADGGEVEGYAGGGDVVKKALDALRGGTKVFPKPERMFPEVARPKGGEYLNAATGEALTGQKPARAVIGVTPEGKPVFLADAEMVEATGSPGPGSTKTKANLFKQRAGWKWTEAPEGYENVPTIVSVENRGQHYYGLGADFPKGVDLERYADAPSEPRLRPTTQGNVYPGEQVGSISVRGNEHPVYDMLTIRNLLAGTGAGAAGAAVAPEESEGRADGGEVESALHAVRRHFDGSDGSFVDPAADLPARIKAYEDTVARVREQPQEIQQMTHLPEKPRAPITMESGYLKDETLGQAPYDVAPALNTLANAAYSAKTLPLYATPLAPAAMASDVTEAAMDKSLAGMGMAAMGAPGKVARYAAPALMGAAVMEPSEAQAARLPRVGGISGALSKVGPQAADTSLEQAMKVARQAIQQPRELSPLGFYSHGAESAMGLPQAKGAPDQMIAMLKRAGVKDAEIEGLAEKFAGQKAVTRDELASHFRENMPVVEEKVLRDKPMEGSGWEEAGGGTKFGQYTLPGGENYREVLLKAPENVGPKTQEARDLVSRINNGEFNSLDDAGRRAIFAKRDQLLREAKSENAPTRLFQSSHWQDPNVLAHLRMSDRTGPNGEKILHIEEVQSDWGQKGKKEGFQKPVPPELQSAADKIIADKIQPQAKLMPRLVDPNTKKISAQSIPEDYINLWKESGIVTPEEAQTLMDLRAAHDARWSGLPSAPYVTSTEGWTDLALKRALKEAAEGGYDKLVWTPGAEQAKRYSLSTHVDRIAYDPEMKELSYVQKGVNGWQTHPEYVEPEGLANIIGKEAADKLLAQEVAPLSGNYVLEAPDLVFGGEGMKGYYDKILPKRLQELAKKHDKEARIGRDTIQTQDTPRTMAYFLDWARAQGDTTPRPLLGEMWKNGANEPLVQKFMKETSGLEVPSITITPAMRESILKGQTAFASGGIVDQALSILRKV